MAGIFKILLIISAILVLIRMRVPLSLALVGSAAALGFLFHLSSPQIGQSFLKGALETETLLLAASLILILFFSAVLKETGNMSRAIKALREVVRDARATVAIIPALIGILPVVGGAMLSAPLVAQASDELKLSPERKTFLNYWFRHVWEYTMPTYPVIVLVATLLEVPVARITLMNLPLTLAAIGVGIILGFRGVHPLRRSASSLDTAGALRQVALFAGNLLPFLLVLVLALYFKLHMAYSIALATLGVVLFYRLSLRTMVHLWRQSFSWEIVFLILGIMIFKEILVASGAIHSVSQEFARVGLPFQVLILVLPAIMGMITGYANALVGLSFPILLPFFQTDEQSLIYVSLAYASGFSAVLLSPMHACLVMTREYYQADLSKLYWMLIPPVAVVFFTAVGVVVISLYVR